MGAHNINFAAECKILVYDGEVPNQNNTRVVRISRRK